MNSIVLLGKRVALNDESVGDDGVTPHVDVCVLCARFVVGDEMDAPHSVSVDDGYECADCGVPIVFDS
jgi:DNA-directed RNA polymerase subunit RPC12/RpoP